jgi:hypothetical protein
MSEAKEGKKPAFQITPELAQKLVLLTDKELAPIVNSWGNIDPESIVGEDIKALIAGVGTIKPTEKSFRDIQLQWSSPANAKELLIQLGVREIKPGPYENLNDGECDLIFSFKDDTRDQEFHLQNNYYNKECYVPVVKWALKKYLRNQDKNKAPRSDN